jgi:hypothetical protein
MSPMKENGITVIMAGTSRNLIGSIIEFDYEKFHLAEVSFVSIADTFFSFLEPLWRNFLSSSWFNPIVSNLQNNKRVQLTMIKNKIKTQQESVTLPTDFSVENGWMNSSGETIHA